MNEDSDDYLFQPNGCPAHFHNDVQGYLNTNLPQHWIGRFGQEDVALMRWPPNHLAIFLVGICKRHSFCTTSPANLQELRDRITAAVTLIDRDMLTRMWNELDCRLDVWCISQGGHIEHL